MKRAEILAIVEDQFFEIRKQLETQLRRTGEVQAQLDQQLRRTGELQAQLDQIHQLIKELAVEA